MARDNFPQSVIQKLKNRAAQRCSNPACRIQTSAPLLNDNTGVNCIGNAAHICAASPNGPRYDKTMTSDQRSSINNAIWLCSNCATKIDRDTQVFTKELLEKWKSITEAQARNELGTRLENREETNNSIISALSGSSTSLLKREIHNIHKAQETYLEKLDPRFTVVSQYVNDSPSLLISPKGSVTLDIEIPSEHAPEVIYQFNAHIEKGQDLRLNWQKSKLRGSELFDTLFDESSTDELIIRSPKVKSTLKLWLENPETNEIEAFDDTNGNLSHGTKYISFLGTCFNNLFETSITFDLDRKKFNADLSFKVFFENWHNLNVKNLPYFNKIYFLIRKLCEGWLVKTSLEWNGEKLISATQIKIKDFDYFRTAENLLSYIDKSRILAKHTESDIFFNSKFSFTEGEHKNLKNITDAFEEKRVLEGREVLKYSSITIVVTENVDKIITEGKTNICVQEEEGEIVVFDQTIKLPIKKSYFNQVILSLKKPDTKIELGKKIEFTLKSEDDFEYYETYEDIESQANSS